MTPHDTSQTRQDISPLAKLGALAGFAITIPAALFMPDRALGETSLEIRPDFDRQTVTIQFPTNSGFSAIQAQVTAANLSSNAWYNISGGLVNSNTTSVTVQMADFPKGGAFFRGVSNEITSDVHVNKEKINSNEYHIVVSGDDSVIRNPDGSIDHSQIGRWIFRNSTDGINWIDSGYSVIPGGVSFGQIVPSSDGSPPYFASRIEKIP